MKQKHLLIAAAALAFASCSKEEAPTVGAPEAFNTKAISFSSNTTRASVVDLAALEADATGFKVYATDAKTPNVWYADADSETIDGENYKYNTGVWAWTSITPLWPTDIAQYPMNFLAIYPAATTTNETVGDLMSDITIKSDPAAQMDIMTASASAASKPSDGKLALCFKHILSRINFNVVAGKDVDVELQRIAVDNVGDNGTYSLQDAAWDEAPTVFASKYTYQELDGVDKFTTTGTDAAEKAGAFVGSTDDYLMLMPQSGAPAWVPATWKTIADPNNMEGAYIEVIYRFDSTSNSEMRVGYASYADHPSYIADPDNTKFDKYEADPTALYVRVAYPLTATWEIGKAYSYNIALGTANATNGYLIDDVYYDKNGEPTDFEVDIDGVEPGDPISSNEINFTVTICKDWEVVTPNPSL